MQKRRAYPNWQTQVRFRHFWVSSKINGLRKNQWKWRRRIWRMRLRRYFSRKWFLFHARGTVRRQSRLKKGKLKRQQTKPEQKISSKIYFQKEKLSLLHRLLKNPSHQMRIFSLISLRLLNLDSIFPVKLSKYQRKTSLDGWMQNNPWGSEAESQETQPWSKISPNGSSKTSVEDSTLLRTKSGERPESLLTAKTSRPAKDGSKSISEETEPLETPWTDFFTSKRQKSWK